MELGWLVLVSILKIAFVIGVLLLVFAPVLVLAERRQSAFFQDRLGPYMGGVQMPRALLDAIPQLQLGAYAVAVVALVTAGLAFGGAFWAGTEVDLSREGLIRNAFRLLIRLGVALAAFVGITYASRGRSTILFWGSAAGSVFLFFAVVGGFASWLTSAEVWTGLLILAVPTAIAHVIAGKILPHLFFDGRLTLFGGLHSLFDAIKAFTKEDIVPPHGDKFLHSVAPIIAMVPAFATAAVIPFGPTIYFDYLLSQLPAEGAVGGTAIDVQVANLNVGILYIFAIAGTGIIGAAVAGYASDNKYALLGGLRAASQMVSYEVTLGLSLVPMFMLYDSLMLPDMIAWQSEHTFWGLPIWGIIVNPLAFILFFTATIAEYKRVPFDAPEGESEIVAGYFLEYSSGKWLMYMMGEFIEVAVSSAIIAVIFLGGWDVPFLTRAGWEAFGYRFDLSGTNFAVISDVANSHLFIVLVQVGAFLAKTMVLALISIQIRWTLPRFRYDQIMSLCWKLILPLALVNILITGLAVLVGQSLGWW